jgi:hypothetical protein
MCGCIASNLFMAVFDESSTVLWIGMNLSFPSPFTSLTQPHLRYTHTHTGTFLYGFSMSSAFPTAIHMAEAYVSLTGTFLSLHWLMMLSGTHALTHF